MQAFGTFEWFSHDVSFTQKNMMALKFRMRYLIRYSHKSHISHKMQACRILKLCHIIKFATIQAYE